MNQPAPRPTRPGQLPAPRTGDDSPQVLDEAQIGELLSTTTTAAPATGTNHDQLDKDHVHNADVSVSAQPDMPVIEGKKETRQGVQTERSWAK